MKPQRILVAGLALTAVALAAGLWFMNQPKQSDALSGYVEGEALYLASPVSGTVTRIDVRRGDTVAAGQALFVVDPTQVAAQRDQAEAEVSAATAQAIDARRGLRPQELAVYDAEIAAAQAALRNARGQLARVEPLARQGFYPRARLDDAREAAQTAEANLAAATRRKAAAMLGARQDQVRAADARVAQARAGLQGAEARLEDLAPRAPSAGRVEEVFFQRGEWVAANQPIVSILPADRVKIRVFVPERQVAAYRVGRTIAFTCDSCPPGLTARIAFVSPRPEFTPPVIYSRGARDRLVFLIEAVPEGGRPLVPGLPVDVTPLPAENRR